MSADSPDRHADDQLDAALRKLREQTLALATPSSVETVLLAAFAQQHPPRRRRWYQRIALPGRNAGVGLASLAGIVFAVMLVLSLPPDRAPAMPYASAEEGGEFFALVDAEHIALETAPQLVETEVARNSLAALGVPLSPENAGDLVRAQFLVGADGRPLALRLLPVLSTTLTNRG